VLGARRAAYWDGGLELLRPFAFGFQLFDARRGVGHARLSVIDVVVAGTMRLGTWGL